MSPPAEKVSDEKTRFQFVCHPGLACFTRCCANLTLVLTPYDILRLKRRLRLPAEAFLDRYTAVSADGTFGLPVIRLRMDPDSGRCPFLSADGCTVYADRPGACRLYPLGQALKNRGDGFSRRYFTVREPHCLGWDQGRMWTVDQWLADQGLASYQRMNEPFLRLSTGRPAAVIKALGERKLQMYFMGCYNLDAFRDFVSGSSLRQRFAISDDLHQRLQDDEAALLEFSGRWLEFALFGAGVLPRSVSQMWPATAVMAR